MSDLPDDWMRRIKEGGDDPPSPPPLPNHWYTSKPARWIAWGIYIPCIFILMFIFIMTDMINTISNIFVDVTTDFLRQMMYTVRNCRPNDFDAPYSSEFARRLFNKPSPDQPLPKSPPVVKAQ